MKCITKLLTVMVFVLSLAFNKAQAQESRISAIANYVFNPDSIAGFDEQMASAEAIAGACFGQEFKVFMYIEKRKFINQKYNIKAPVQKAEPIVIAPYKHPVPNALGKSAALPSSGACSNEDFEDAQSNPGPQIGGPVNGWSLFGGTGATYCNPVAVSATNLYTVFNAPYVDPYMIFPTNSISSYFDATSNSQPAGSCFIRLNNDLAGAKVVKASKSYIVTPANAVFRYAYRAVISNPGHACCQQPGFVIHVTITNTVTNTSTLLACPNVSIAAGNACGPAAPGFSVGNPLNGSPSAYNPTWVPASMDLSPYLNNQVTLEVFAIDCQASGHAGYVYFDALCQPMNVIGNGQGFPAGTPSITLPTCGANGATITAPPGLGPYSWNSNAINIPANLTVPSNTNTTLITNQSGTVQLTMSPPGGCAPINKVITVSITPAPILLASATQPGCTSTLSAASITCAGSASVAPTISWSPMPGSLAGNSLSATGVPVGITTITVYDQVGCVAIATVMINAAPPPVTFTINNLTGSYSITCTNPTINLQAVSNYTYGTISYSWSSPSFTANTPTVSITAPVPTLNVLGIDLATGCQFTTVVSIGINTTAPTTTVTPLSQVITCNAVTPITFTGTVTNPTVNVQHDWYSPLNPLPSGVPISTSNNTVTILSGVIPPGVYTLVTTNLVNGCQTVRSVTVTSLDAWPSFGINSSTNYSVGCVPLNQTTLSIINPVSTQTPPATCSFTFLPPGFVGVVANGSLGVNASTITTLPGTWTVIVNDNSNNCRTILTVPIVQNTAAPHVTVAILQQTLTCFHPTLLATGSSTTPNTDVTWIKPIAPPSVPNSTIIIGPGTGPNTSTTSLTYANYTVVSTNSINACVTTSVVVISQNFKLPVSSPTISSGSAQGIYCNAGVNPVVLTTGASAPGSGVANAFVANPCWDGPPPQGTVCGASSYSCYIPGTYSLTVMDSYNGCTKTQTVFVIDKTQPPVITNPVATATLDCGSGYATMDLALTGTIGAPGVRNIFTEYPVGAAFNPVSAPNVNANPAASGTSSQVVQASKIGTYEYYVYNILTGCVASGTVNVVAGEMTADFDASPLSGYAPLGVTFNNTSHSALGSGSITSVWSYGNGATETNSTNASTSTIYTAPGTYTVMLIASKGDCIDTASKVIKVELPSKMEVPNVFTPNGDGNNDVFFLKTANLTEINAFIFDRWGNKVYEVTSASGNIAWDGKSLQGKDCPAGVYFYIIKAKGKDGVDYETKGNISLFK